MHEKLASLLDQVPNDVTIFTLSAAFLAHELPDVNWLGFYLADDDGLFLGPFQGLPACIHILMEGELAEGWHIVKHHSSSVMFARSQLHRLSC
jgi:putative methionine-R-sulfoxide reductase with GAF domain